MTAATAKRPEHSLPPRSGSDKPRFPISTPGDVDNAVRAVGRVRPNTPEARAKVRRYIMSAAAKIGASSRIPATWNSDGTLSMSVRVSHAQLVDLAERHPAKAELIELAGKWRHGWIPLDAIAAAIKAKRYHGGHGGNLPKAGAGKSRINVNAHKARALNTGGARRKSAPKFQRTSHALNGPGGAATFHPSELVGGVEPHHAVRMKAAELRQHAAAGSTVAKLELKRREDKRAALRPATERAQQVAQDRHRANEANRAPQIKNPNPATLGAKPKRKPSQTYLEYHQLRAEQDRRFEAHTGGGISAKDTHTQEYKDYFGVGDHSTSTVEKRLTYKSHLESRRADPAEQHHMKSYDAGIKLGLHHGRHGSSPSDSEYNAAATGHSDEHFGQGFTDGVIAGEAQKRQTAAMAAEHTAMPTQQLRARADAAPEGSVERRMARAELDRRASAKVDKARARQRAYGTVARRGTKAEAPQVVGTMSNHNEIVTVQKTNGKHRVKVDGRIHSSHTEHEQALAEAHSLVPEHRRASSESEALAKAKAIDVKAEADRKAAVAARGTADVDGKPIATGDHVQVLSISGKPLYSGTAVGTRPGLGAHPVVEVKLPNGKVETFPGATLRKGDHTIAAPNASGRPTVIAQVTHTNAPAPSRRLNVGDRVESEFGKGTVTEHTDRSVTYKLDNGETLNVQRGTPGYDRIKKSDAPSSGTSATVTALPPHGHDVVVHHQGTDYRRSGGGVFYTQPAKGAGQRVESPTLQRRLEGAHFAALTKFNEQNAPAEQAAHEAEKARKAAVAQAMRSHPDAINPHAGSAADVAHRAAASQSRDAALAQGKIVIEHSGDGTTVHGTTKADAPALKQHGFRWSRNLGAWYLPRNQHEPTRARSANALKSTLGDRAEMHTGSLAKSGTAAERMQANVERANQLATSHRTAAEKLSGEADARFGRAREIGSHIPFGQPILVGHHSEGRHRSDLAKIDTNMRKGFEAHSASEEAAGRAKSAEARARQLTDPKAAARRLERNQAELRRVQRSLAGTPTMGNPTGTAAAGSHAERLRAREAELHDIIAHDRTIAGDQLTKYGPHNVAPGDVVKIRGHVSLVTAVGPKNVKVHTSVGPLPYPHTQITGHAPFGTVSRENLEKIVQGERSHQAATDHAMKVIETRAKGEVAIKNAATMFGDDRSKWSTSSLRSAAKIGDQQARAELQQRGEK